MENKFLIVVPFYNEEKRLNDEFILSLLNVTEIDYVFVDDGSKDNTLEILLKRYIGFSNVGIDSLPCNVGKSEAIRLAWKSTLNSANYEYVGFLDSDGALALEDVLDCLLIAKRSPSIDAIWKSRVGLSGRNIQRSVVRHYISRLIATFFGLADSNLPYDTQCGLKLFKTSNAFKIAVENPLKTRWFIDLEIYSRLQSLLGNKLVIWEQPCLSWIEIENSKLSLTRSVSLVHEMIFVFKLLKNSKSKLV